MIVLYIILALLLLVSVILLTNISLVFSYNESFSFKLKIFGISLNGEKLIELAENSGSKKPSELQSHKKSASKKKKSPYDVIDTVGYIIDLISAIFGEFIKYARLKFAKIKISIGSDNCADTAILYGIVSSALYSLLEFFDSFMTVKRNYKSIGVFPDFTSDRCKVDMKIILRIKIIYLLLILLNILPTLAEAKKGK